MVTEATALLLPCPLLDGKVKVIEGYYCDGSRCPHWEWLPLNNLKANRVGRCYWLDRVRDHERGK